MDRSLVYTCRGCTRDVTDDPVSLLRPGVRQLYEKCTHLSLPDHATDTGPQQICWNCLNKCLGWLKFQTICNTNEQRYSSRENVQSPEPLEFVDGTLEDMVLQVEEDEEDLLAALLYDGQEITNNTAIDWDQEDVVIALFTEIDSGQTTDNATASNEVPKTIYSDNCIEQRLSMLMDIPLDEPEDPNNNLKTVPPESQKESLSQQLNHCILENSQENCLGDSVVDKEHDSLPTLTDQPAKEETDKVNETTDNEVTPESLDKSQVISDEEEENFDDLFYFPPDCPEEEDERTGVKQCDYASTQESQGDNVELWICSVCDANLLGAEAYRDHLQLHLAEDEVKSKERINKRKAEKEDRHKEVSPAKKKREEPKAYKNWKCPLCVFSEISKSRLHFHLKHIHHQQLQLKKCPICPPSDTIGSKSLFQHLLKCHIGMWRCGLCFEFFKKQKQLLQHKFKFHNSKETGRFRGCPLCEEPCKVGGLEEHLIKKHLDSGVLLDCPACSAPYESTNDVIDHIVSYHATKWTCTICGSRSYSAKAFSCHLRWHVEGTAEPEKEPEQVTGPKKAKYHCQVCDRIFMSAFQLYDHQGTAHLV